MLAPALHVSYLLDSCRVWRVPKAPAEQRAATPSTIPTLLLSGSFDGVTPTLGADSGADAAELDARRLWRDRPLRDGGVALRARGVRVVPRDTERAEHGVRRGGQATDVHSGAARAAIRTWIPAPLPQRSKPYPLRSFLSDFLLDALLKRYLDPARASLGDEYEAVRAQGRALASDDAVELVLGDDPQVAMAQTTPDSGLPPLAGVERNTSDRVS